MKIPLSSLSRLYIYATMTFIIFGCTKEAILINASPEAKPVTTTSSTYTTYVIRQGQHYCDQSTIKSVTTAEMKFVARFDSTAIYQTISLVNQYDINKLYGFTEGIDNQYNSARFGWRWSEGALRLFGYVYKNGVRNSLEIGNYNLNSDIICSIKLNGSSYIFTANGLSISLPRGPSTLTASGYQQYPYFGGDETAPHTINIKIKPN